MSRAFALPLAAVLLLLPACRAPGDAAPTEVLAHIVPGTWVEAKGRTRDGVPYVSEIDEAPREASDKADKVEITAAVEAAGADAVTVLGHDVFLTPETEWEDAEKRAVARFALAPRDWVRLKVRVKDDGRLLARTVRASTPRDRFQVLGEVRKVEPAAQRIAIASVELRAAADVGFDDAAQAASERTLHEDPLELYFADERKGVPFTLRPFDSLWFGGELAGQAGNDEDFDLDGSRTGDRALVQGSVRLGMLWRIDQRGSFALVEGESGYRHRGRAGAPDSYSNQDSLTRAYAYLLLNEVVRLQVGRQDFDEEREWLYDERLDGARLHLRRGAWHFEAGGAVGREFADVDSNGTEDRALLTALARYYLDTKWWLTAYWLDVDDGSANDFEPTLFGLRSYSRPWQGLGHWGELAWARGHDGNKDIDGWAFDVGLLYRFDLPLRPSVYGGYAYAPGRDPNDTRTGFRQSGFQDNNAKFGGVTSFKYYGEIALPELSNGEVATLGFGLRPGSFSVDVVLHTYAQDYAATSWSGTDLRTRPNGRSGDLGWEIDAVLGYRYEDRVSAELVLGRFEPGSAFDDRDAAFKAEAQVRLKW